MYCKYCGQPIGDDDAFCTHCGAQLKEIHSDAENVTPSDLPKKKPLNALGLAGFIVAIASVVLGEFSLFAVIAGLILSAVGLARRKNYSLNGFAIAGVAIASAGLFICLLILLFCSWLFWGLVWFA